jgi:hypothetical protein
MAQRQPDDDEEPRPLREERKVTTDWLAFFRRHALLIAACVALTIPMLVVRHPPMEDFPVHVATLRVIHHMGDPAFSFARDFELTLGRTQYVGFYAVGHLLAFVLGIRGAVQFLVLFAIVGTVLGLRSLLVALDRDERLVLAVIPALYGTLFTIGLLPFLVATPVLLWGIAALVRRGRNPKPRAHIVVAVLGVVLFYLHVIHLGIFLGAAIVLLPWRSSNSQRVGSLASIVPASGLLVHWMLATNVGRRIFEVGTNWGGKNRPPLGGAIADLHTWIGDAFSDPSDEIVFALFLATLAYAAVKVHREKTETPLPHRAYWVIPLFCLLLFLTGERSRGAIWPLGQRYAFLAAVLGIPLLAFPKLGHTKRTTTILLAGAGLLSLVNTIWHWIRFEREVGEFDTAIGELEPNKHVAALVYRRHGESVRFYPFLHFGSYYQAEKGGVVMFAFAGYDQWPFDFKEGRYPLWDGPATPRWEFFPAQVARTQPLADYFDYVIVRPNSDDDPIPPGFRLKWSGDAWKVYER